MMAPAAAATSTAAAAAAWIPPAALPCRRDRPLAAAAGRRRAASGTARSAAAAAVPARAGWVAIAAPPRPTWTAPPAVGAETNGGRAGARPTGARAGSSRWHVGNGGGGPGRWPPQPAPTANGPPSGRAAGAAAPGEGGAGAPPPPSFVAASPPAANLDAVSSPPSRVEDDPSLPPPSLSGRGDRQLVLRSPTALAAELRRFSASIGADPGAMPREADLLRHRRGDLRYAIRAHHGGYRAAASAAALRYTGAAAAGRYAHFSALAADLRAFIDARAAGVADTRHAALAARHMPRVVDLLDAGRSDLAHAIAAHGGQHVVARRLGLHLHYHAVTHYRGAWGVLVEEVWRFIADRDGVPAEERGGSGGRGTIPTSGGAGGDSGAAAAAHGRFPTTAQLRAAGRLDLVAGIKAHGGVVVVASLLGLKLQVGRRRSGSAAVAAAVRVPAPAADSAAAATPAAVAGQCGGSGDGGSDAKLAWLGRQLAAIAAAADDDGLGGVLRPAWTAPTTRAVVEEAAAARSATAPCVAAPVCAVMPSSTALLRSGRVDVLRAISAAGGRAAVAKALGIPHLDRSVLVEEWAGADVVASAEALAYNGGNALNAGRLGDALPLAATATAAAGRAALAVAGIPSAVPAAGCAAAPAGADNLRVASRGSAAMATTTSPPRPAEPLPFPPSPQPPLPRASPPDWEAGRGGGGGALLARHGGRRRPAHHWSDFSAVRTELAAFCYDNGSPGVMPTAAELAAAGRRDLVRGMARYGGLKAVADRLGWVRVSLSGVEARRRALRVAQSTLRR